MTPAYVVRITTPKKYILNGLWFGPKKARRAFIFIHGFSGSMFGETAKRLSEPLIATGSAMLMFNNRGHDVVSKLYRDAPGTKKGYKRINAGAAHEKFTDCVDDIEGAVRFAEKAGAKEIVLVGHSTGCQKSAYWASKKGVFHTKVRAVVLLAPVSDRSAYLKEVGEKKLEKVERIARALIKKGKEKELLPAHIWPNLLDAQRFLSLSSVDSEEEIFPYAQPKRRTGNLQKIRIPTMVFWPANDEYESRPAKEVAAWFEKNLKPKHKVVIVPKVGHSFHDAEKQIAREIAKFMKES